MNLGQRFIGVFTNPRETFGFLTEKPVWLDALIVILIASIIYGYLIAPFAAKDTYETYQTSTKLRQRLGEDAFNQMLEQQRKKAEEMTTTGRLQQGLMTGVGIIIFLFIQTLFLLIFSKFFSTQGSFRHLLSAMLHASFINSVLGNSLRYFLASFKQSVFKISTGLAVFFPNLEPTSSSYIILNTIDFFQLWMFGVMGYALSAIFKFDLKKSLIISYLFWGLKTIVNIAVTIFGLSQI